MNFKGVAADAQIVGGDILACRAQPDFAQSCGASKPAPYICLIVGANCVRPPAKSAQQNGGSKLPPYRYIICFV